MLDNTKKIETLYKGPLFGNIAYPTFISPVFTTLVITLVTKVSRPFLAHLLTEADLKVGLIQII